MFVGEEYFTLWDRINIIYELQCMLVTYLFSGFLHCIEEVLCHFCISVRSVISIPLAVRSIGYLSRIIYRMCYILWAEKEGRKEWVPKRPDIWMSVEIPEEQMRAMPSHIEKEHLLRW